MKRVAFAFVIFLLVVTASCVSSPNWTGSEVQPGEIVWSYSPGIRLFINLIVVAVLLALPAFGLVVTFKNQSDVPKSGIVFSIAFLLLLLGWALWANLRNYVWLESYALNQDRIEHTSCPSVRKAEKEILEWKNVAAIDYIPEKSFRQESWIWVYSSTGEPTGSGGTQGTTGRAIILTGKDGSKIELALEKRSYSTGFLSGLFYWIFGSTDFTVARQEENRLKKIIYDFLPESIKLNAPPETTEYFSKE